MTASPVALNAAVATPAGAVAAALTGDHRGWDWLFDRYHATICRYAMARLGDQAAAEDVAQDVFVAAVGALERLRDRSDAGVTGFLLGIAKYKVIDRLRRKRRDVGPAAAPALLPDAAEVAVRRLHAVRARAALELLPDAQREVVLRRFVLDQPLDEVALAMRRRVGAVKALQHRALAALARRLGEGRE